MKTRFVAGEVRHVKLKITSINGDYFGIKEAKWELYTAQSLVPVSEGDCTILENNIIDMVISPRKKVAHKLVVTYIIADETLKDTVEIEVV